MSCSIASLYYSQGKYAEALEYHNKSLEIDLRVVGPDHPHVASTYKSSRVIYRQQAKYPEALEMYAKCLKIEEKVHGLEHPDVASTYMK